MVLVERRLFAVVHQIMKTGEYPVQRYVDVDDSDSDVDNDLELTLSQDLYQVPMRSPVHWIEGQINEMINATVSRNSDLPAYPILKYVLSPDTCRDQNTAGALDEDTSGPCTYEQALSLDQQTEFGEHTIQNAMTFKDESAS